MLWEHSHAFHRALVALQGRNTKGASQAVNKDVEDIEERVRNRQNKGSPRA